MIYVVTGRMESDRARTVEALAQAQVFYDKLFLNDLGKSQEEQLVFKWQTVLAFSAQVVLALDDNSHVREMYKKIGILNVF